MKKRYQLTLTKETVDRFQTMANELKIPAGAMSLMVDDLLSSTVAAMEKFVSKGKKLSLADLFTVIGEQLEKEEAQNADEKEKKN